MVYSDVYADPLPNQSFAFVLHQSVVGAYGVGTVIYVGRYLSYRHTYLVRYTDGRQCWESESRLSAV